MGMQDFIFGGQSPPNTAPTGGNTNVPQYLSDAQMDYVNKVHGVANMPYQTNPNPRVAGPSDNQTGAWSTIGGIASQYDPAIHGALTATQGVMPTANKGFDTAAGDITKGTGTFTGRNVSDYMNPYLDQVTNRSAQLATRNFDENILPGLNSQFVGAGQFGSTPNAAVAYRGARDVTQNIQDDANATYAQGFDTAGSNFRSDQGRDITAGQALGTLANNRGALGLQASDQASREAIDAGTFDLKAAAARDAAGQEQTGYNQKNLDVLNSDWQNQNDYLKNQLGWEGQMFGNVGPTSTSKNSTGPAPYYDASPLGTGAAGGALSGLLHAKGGVVKEPDNDELPGWLQEALKELMRAHRRGALSAG